MKKEKKEKKKKKRKRKKRMISHHSKVGQTAQGVVPED